MWSDGVCCIDWLSCAYAQLFIILTSRAAWATVLGIFLFHFCYTSGYPGCGARDSWCMFIIRLLFSSSDLFEHLSAEKAAIKCCISSAVPCLLSGFYLCPTMPMKQAADHDFSFSPPDCGTWISPPAQCPGLQPISPSHGHWDTIRSHQIVSFKHLGWEFFNLNRMWSFEDTSTVRSSMNLQARVTGILKQFARVWSDFGLIKVGLSFQELSYSSNRSWADADIKQDSALAMQKVRLDLA